MTQQDRTPAGAHRYSGGVAVARVPVGAGPAVTIVMITAMSRAPARPAGKPSSVHRRADELVAFGREMGRDSVSAATGEGPASAPHSMRRVSVTTH